jgi:hypothetical protein
MAGLALIELKIAVTLYKAIIRSEKTSEQMCAELSQQGMPEWVVKIMTWEAMVWKKLFVLFKKR